MANKSFEQQIAVFGESGSGKTVLLSSLYGTLQEATHKEDAFFRFQAVDAAMHNMLMQTYLGMRDDNAAPLPSAFKSTQHVFTIKPLSEPLKPKNGSKNLRLTWHDYPGEWFERSALGESEAEDRAKTFKNLLGADVAIFLIDAARLLEYPGEEERYLKSVFSNFQNSLLEVKDRVIEEGAQLEQFPRIWMIALSKADLLPEMTVESFQELVILKAGAEINALRQVIADFVGHDDALSVGEDYVLLSSAQFTPGHIDLQNQKGIDIILPLATIFPMERFLKWKELKALPLKLLDKKFAQAAPMIIEVALAKVLPKLPIFKKFPAAVGFAPLLAELADSALDGLRQARDNALENQDFYSAFMAEFMSKLKIAERDHVFAKSHR